MTRFFLTGIAALVLANSTSVETAMASDACSVTSKVTVISALPLLPGEPLDMNFRITNPASSAIQFHEPSEETGSVRLLFSNDAAPTTFKKYRGPLWGLVDDVTFPAELGAKKSFDLPLRVLQQAGREPFVFNAPGTYRIKLTYQDRLACQRALETPTVEIKVNAPTGEDLAVWNAIKGCADCAFFLHTGKVLTPEDQVAVTLLRSLAKQYPKSRYSKLFRKQLDALDEKSRGDHNNDAHPDQGKPPPSE